MKITSKDNAKIKEAIVLRDKRSYRKETGRIFLEGLRLCADALSSGIKVETLFFTESAREKLVSQNSDFIDMPNECFEIPDPVADKLSDTKNSQGVFCVCKMPVAKNIKDLDISKGIIMLSSLQDPGNVGTIIRSCEAFGLGGVVLSEDCPDIYSQKVLRGTMGGVFRLPIITTSNIIETIGDLQCQHNISVYGAALGSNSKEVGEICLKGQAVVIGNEGNGLTDEVKAACDGLVIIPISKESESLNAAVAASVLAWEMVR